uniref:SEP domain-containing protein n=1 Tax=Angiostrongylus cantonensis TaxID=6313 RepID=A0A0K0DDN6_ANGCA
MSSAKKDDSSHMRNAIGAVEEKKTKTAAVSNTRLPTKLADVGIEGKKSKKETTGRFAEKAMEKCFARDNNGCRNGEKKTIKRSVRDEGATKKEGKSKEKTTNEGRRRYSSIVGHSGNDDSPSDPPTLEAHVEAIRERRKSLPRTILIDPTTQVEIVIGDDGKPYFQPTFTPKTEEIFEEFAGILLEEDNEDGCKKLEAAAPSTNRGVVLFRLGKDLFNIGSAGKTA